jgi:CPA1 family monovalent cation:H+ antiporter
MEHHALLTLAGIGLIGIACQWLAWRVRLPAILFLLLAGIVAGPVTGWLKPDKLFGELLFPFVSLSVAVILFEGALTLRFDRLRGLGQVVRRMVIAGLVITWLVCAASAWLFLGYSVELALLFGALVVVTGPTVIAPMLRVVRPKPAVAEVLRWEGIVIDPFGALLAVLVFEFLVARGEGAAWSHTLMTFTGTLVVGIGIGAIAGWLLGVLLRRHAIPDYLQNVFTLALVGGAFAASDSVVPESGLLAVTVMGMVLANLPRVHVEEILDFKESLSVLLISTLFVVLAARIELEQLQALGWGALGVLAVAQ